MRAQVRRQWLKCQGRNIKSEENLVGKGVPVSVSSMIVVLRFSLFITRFKCEMHY